MKTKVTLFSSRVLLMTVSLLGVLLSSEQSHAQTCPATTTTTITANPDTYYPAKYTTPAGVDTISLGPVGSGSTAIAAGDMVLIIQMQGATFDTANNHLYGDGVSGTGSGYLAGGLLVGHMEFATAASAVPTTGGSLTLAANLVNSYQSSPYSISTAGQYTYQVIRVPLYYNLVLGGTITAQSWNGTTGGVVILDATNSMALGGQTVTAAGAGFRGGGGRELRGGAGFNTDYVSLATRTNDGSKGEGMAGTPRFINNSGVLLDNGSANEGYPNGSYSRGAPGNAGGGATDWTPSNNADNAGGGGGGNGGMGGQGGQGWAATGYSGGSPGALFAQVSPSRMIMGGGGGSGDTNDGTGVPAGGLASSGVTGGGIVILLSPAYTGTGTVNANGTAGYTTIVNDGSGGGGAGGSILIYGTTGTTGITATANGGAGGTNGGGGSPPYHGPGGGGGGGVIYASGLLASASATGGVHGVTAGDSAYLSTSGSAGVINQGVTNTQLPPNTMTCMTLPVTFLSVTGVYNAPDVTLDWSVTDEINVKNYAVERSLDGVTFTTIGVVSNQASYNGGLNQYTYNDTYKSAVPVLYYRIVEQDASGGKLTASNVVSVSVTAVPRSFSAAPNPINTSATVNYTTKTDNPINVRLVSVAGVVAWERQYAGGSGNRLLIVDNIANLSTGIYILQCSDGIDLQQTKVMITH